MKLNKIMWRPRELENVGGVTPEAQKEYEEQLIVRARTGRIVTMIVCVMNIFVSSIVGICGMGWLLSAGALAGIVFSVKGRTVGRIMHASVCFLLSLIGYSVTLVYILGGGTEETANIEMLFKFIGVYGIITCVFMLRSKHIGSWFEYAGSYKCRYLGKRFFEKSEREDR